VDDRAGSGRLTGLPNDVDVAVIGAAHNGLVAACYLPKAGLRVTVVGCRRPLAARRVGDEPHARYPPGSQRSDMTGLYRALSAASAMLLSIAGLLVNSARAHADPIMHHVKYTVSAQHPIYTDIYYLDHEPNIFADYSHNPYSFTPHVDVDIAPGTPWSYELDLSKPEVYAMVSATTGTEPGAPQLHCDLAVDGSVVVSKDGEKGVLCSIRNW
jgi:hypothetical protein